MNPVLPLSFIQGLGWTEVVVILFVILLLFGAKRLPELARSFGKSIKEFKKATTSVEDDLRSALEDEPETPRQKSEGKTKEAEKVKPASNQED